VIDVAHSLPGIRPGNGCTVAGPRADHQTVVAEPGEAGEVLVKADEVEVEAEFGRPPSVLGRTGTIAPDHDASALSRRVQLPGGEALYPSGFLAQVACAVHDDLHDIRGLRYDELHSGRSLVSYIDAERVTGWRGNELHRWLDKHWSGRDGRSSREGAEFRSARQGVPAAHLDGLWKLGAQA